MGLRKKDVNLTDGVLTVEQTAVLIRGTISLGTPKSDASRRPVALPDFVLDAVRGPWEKAINPNVPPKDVQAIAGHSSFAVTMDIYGHLMEGAHKEAAKKLDGVFKV